MDRKQPWTDRDGKSHIPMRQDEDDTPQSNASDTVMAADQDKRNAHPDSKEEDLQDHSGQESQLEGKDEAGEKDPSTVMPTTSTPSASGLNQRMPTTAASAGEPALPEFIRSDPYPRLPLNHPIPQAPRTIGRGEDAGSNLLALFGNDNRPRTRYHLRVREGRTGNDAWRRYRPSNATIPAGLSLEDICRQYPNHVWGTGLRLFEAEGWKAKRIWDALPPDGRNQGAGIRPWNYLQARVGREKKALYEEQTGRKWEPKPKSATTSASASAPVPAATSAPPRAAPPLPPPQPPRSPQSEGQRLEQLVRQEQARVFSILVDLNRDRGMADPRTAAERQWHERHSHFTRQLNAALDGQVPGMQSAFNQDPVDVLRMMWQWDNGQNGNESWAEYGFRSMREARRSYIGNMQRWGVRWEQELAHLASERSGQVIGDQEQDGHGRAGHREMNHEDQDEVMEDKQ
ncbi:hypothetical protein LTR99_003810 [Exophiala xenobiotica]|uniref:Uncharacterized protein n=1 Tax=Vermiconidia calcicola TaxID=1690605 RepID=A0AAV9Q217_9PEZI|nr:hypothetical protein LTR99_003810 [Exophiala xenobiotica]KAK5435278.1 hypothetical protein LTR34_002781 [Exophiala xenobiotica]KAK5531503.1 hypothetical protein LTR25_008612 [Vermiconidia calcicola]